MKKILSLLLLTFTLSSILAQTKADLNLVGISAEAEKKALAGDRIFYAEFEDGSSSRNIIVQIVTPKGKKRFFGSADVKIDANGHYDFKTAVSIKESSKVSFAGEIEILISMTTIFGNSFWTNVTYLIQLS